MVKLDLTLLRYLTKDDFRILTAVEMGMKNHEHVPASLVASIARLQHGGVGKELMELTRHKLVCFERGKRYDGYRLNYLGYDYLALNVLRIRGILASVGNQIGVGKESDVFVAADDDGKQYALKIHRLGRTCFRTVTLNRDYTRQGKKVHNWIYMSRLAALREFAFMKALHRRGYPIPIPVDCNRHCIVMELIDGTLLNHVAEDAVEDVGKLYDRLIELLIMLANEYGVVHGDYNEFNIMIKEGDEPVLIDFPQMVAVNHRFAPKYFERDVKCITEFFSKRFKYTATYIPTWEEDVVVNDEVASEVLDELKKAVSEDPDIDEDFEITEDEGEEEDENLVVEGTDTNKQVQKLPNIQHDGEDCLIAEQTTEDRLQNIIENVGDSNDEDKQSEFSIYSNTSRCTFAPQEVKSKVKRQQNNKQKRQNMKAATKNIKGDASAVRRFRKDDRITIKEDLKTHALDGF